jgi:outer membrane protein OmpA-like peptidoglycan-associated protein
LIENENTYVENFDSLIEYSVNKFLNKSNKTTSLHYKTITKKINYFLDRNMSRRNTILILYLLCATLVCAQDLDTIRIINGSFEDNPRNGAETMLDIKGWYDCGRLRFPNESPPDIHPGGYWKNMVPSLDGKTYLGMVVRDNDSYEGVSQRLSTPIKAGSCYEFSVSLAKSPQYISRSKLSQKEENYTRPAVLRVWGGTGYCNERELLAESPPVDNESWQTYKFSFKAKTELRYILVEAYYKTPVILPYNGHILLDKVTNISEVLCPDKKALADLNTKDKAQSLPPHKRGRIENAVKKPVESNPSATVPITKNVAKEEPKKKILEDLDIKKIRPGVTIELKSLFFKADSTNFDDSSVEVLEELADFLEDNKKVTVEIGGHTNGVPPPDYCDKLSSERAKSVFEFLVSQGISRDRLSYKGYGKRFRIANDATPEGRKKNQRVEIKVISV